MNNVKNVAEIRAEIKRLQQMLEAESNGITTCGNASCSVSRFDIHGYNESLVKVWIKDFPDKESGKKSRNHTLIKARSIQEAVARLDEAIRSLEAIKRELSKSADS